MMSNLAAASTGRARAADQSAQKSADSARQLATAFLGISSMAENLNSWLVSETSASGDGPGRCFASALSPLLLIVHYVCILWCFGGLSLSASFLRIIDLCQFLNPSSTNHNPCYVHKQARHPKASVASKYRICFSGCPSFTPTQLLMQKPLMIWPNGPKHELKRPSLP